MIACLTVAEFFELLISIATLGVAILGLGFVYVQIRQVKEQLYLQHFADYTKRYQEIILQFPEEINDANFDLTARSDRTSVMRQMRAYTDLCFEEWFLRQNFNVDERVWAIWDGGMSTAFSKRAFKDAWTLIKKDTEYGSDFTAFIDDKVVSDFKRG